MQPQNQNNLHLIAKEVDKIYSITKEFPQRIINRGKDINEIVKQAELLEVQSKKFLFYAEKTKRDARNSKIRKIALGLGLVGVIGGVLLASSYIIMAAAAITTGLVISCPTNLISWKLLVGAGFIIGMSIYLKRQKNHKPKIGKKVMTVVEQIQQQQKQDLQRRKQEGEEMDRLLQRRARKGYIMSFIPGTIRRSCLSLTPKKIVKFVRSVTEKNNKNTLRSK